MTDPNHYADMYNAYEKTPKKIRILDSTLREGEQHPGCFIHKQTTNSDSMDVRLFWS